jgi:penicillin-insensitive murein endopeptidase
VADLTARAGGRHSRHGSHRTGRDVDVLFYLSDERGRSVRGSGFYGFDERGVSYVPSQSGAPVRGLAFFDTERNWALVRAWVLDEEAPVQWIFCAEGIKARLLAHAAEHEQNPEALLRATYVLHQPSRGNPHRDHFHVRLACTGEERAHGCLEGGPVWPWLRNAHEKPAGEGAGSNDAMLVRALLEEPSGGSLLAEH